MWGEMGTVYKASDTRPDRGETVQDKRSISGDENAGRSSEGSFLTHCVIIAAVIFHNYRRRVRQRFLGWFHRSCVRFEG